MGFDVRNLLGIPFRCGGRDRTGIDCFGVLIEAFKQNAIEIQDPLLYDKPVATGESDVFEENRSSEWIETTDTLRKGDVITFSKDGGDIPTHCGLLLADGKVLHATEKQGVISTPLRWFKKRICRIYRHKCLA